MIFDGFDGDAREECDVFLAKPHVWVHLLCNQKSQFFRAKNSFEMFSDITIPRKNLEKIGVPIFHGGENSENGPDRVAGSGVPAKYDAEWMRSGFEAGGESLWSRR